MVLQFISYANLMLYSIFKFLISAYINLSTVIIKKVFSYSDDICNNYCTAVVLMYILDISRNNMMSWVCWAGSITLFISIWWWFVLSLMKSSNRILPYGWNLNLRSLRVTLHIWAVINSLMMLSETTCVLISVFNTAWFSPCLQWLCGHIRSSHN